MSVTIAHTDANGLLNAEAGAAVTALIRDQAITDTEKTDLTDGGDTTLHHHDSDRDRANHTGTQGMATVTSGTTSDGVLVDSTTVLSAADKTDLTDGGNTTLHGHTGAKIDISALGESRTVTTLADYLANNADYNVKDYGASTSGTAADNTTAINTAITAAAAAGAGVVKIPPGIDYNQDDLVTDAAVDIIDDSRVVRRQFKPVRPLIAGQSAIEIIAHRGGAEYAPENTLAAFGLSAGRAHSAEFDVQFASGGEAVVIHDSTVDRTTDGTGDVADLTLAELQALDAGTWFDDRFAGQLIPTLGDVLAFCAPRFRTLYPEIKATRTDHQEDDVTTMIQAIIDAGLEDRCVIQTATLTDIPFVRALSSRLTVGYVAANATQWTQALPTMAADGNAVMIVDYSVLTADSDKVSEARAFGVDVIAWTVETSDVLRQLVAIGVTRIMSNVLTLSGVGA